MSGSEERGQRRSASAARWLIVVLLAFVAGALAGQLLVSASPARAQTGSAGRPDGVFAIAGQLTRETYGLYLVDVQNGTICLYEYLNRDRCLRLMAARTFVYDRKLDSYNTKPLPADVAKMVAEARRLKDAPTPKR